MSPDQSLFRVPIYKNLYSARVPHKTMVKRANSVPSFGKTIGEHFWIKDRIDPATTPPAEGSYVLPGFIQSLITPLYLKRKTITRRNNQKREATVWNTGMDVGSKSKSLWYNVQSYLLPALWPWRNHVTLFSSFICKRGIGLLQNELCHLWQLCEVIHTYRTQLRNSLGYHRSKGG